MTQQDFKSQVVFEETLTVGSPVQVRWTAGYGYYEGTATVKKVNAKSIVVDLDTPVTDSFFHIRTFTEVSVPRRMNLKQWSLSNCVSPVDEA